MSNCDSGIAFALRDWGSVDECDRLLLYRMSRTSELAATQTKPAFAGFAVVCVLLRVRSRFYLDSTILNSLKIRRFTVSDDYLVG
ncbi:hypothetical protein [Microseira wollei]|uniref:hypothetical protein n=1 Tax=Microseira wollei TaxID=467598 RepID=UPI001CFCF024|nr:hypothetical protein [Microseira wollei]